MKQFFNIRGGNHCTKRRCSQIKPQLRIEIEDGREARKPCILHNNISLTKTKPWSVG